MPKKRKRKSTRINWEPIIWVAFVLNVVAGICLSPITAIRVVKVKGVEVENQRYVSSVLRGLKGTPALQTNSTAIESRIRATSSVFDASFRRNIFGRGSLTVTYRTPVAKLADKPFEYLSNDGVVFTKVVGPARKLPSVSLFEGAMAPTSTLVAHWPSKRVADLIANLDKGVFGPTPTVEIKVGGAVSLRPSESDTVVHLGAPIEFDRKLAKLKELLAGEPDLFRKAKVVQLVEPTRPSIVPR